jgi:hypothetical protein
MCAGESIAIGSNPPASLTGASLPLKLTLTQAGSQVSGTAEFSNFTVQVTGTVNATGRLELAGSASVNPANVSISNWNTTVSGTSITGSWRTTYVLTGIGFTQVDSTIRRVTLGGDVPAPPSEPPLTTIAEVSSGVTGFSGYAGQSITVAGGAFNNIRFNWQRRDGAGMIHPVAFGTLYLLTQEYLGAPAALSPSTPGFLTRSTRVEDDQYRFDAGVTLQTGVKYWFYTDARSDLFTMDFRRDTYPGGDFYNTSSGPNYAKYPADRAGEFVDANFTLQGRSLAPR